MVADTVPPYVHPKGEPDDNFICNGGTKYFVLDRDKLLSMRSIDEIKLAFKRPYMHHHKMTEAETAFADGYNKCREKLLQLLKELENDLTKN